MNKTLLSAALIAGFGIAALAPQAARATDGTITFAGKIVANTCTIGSSSGPTGTTGTASFTVTLPTVASGALGTTAGTVAGATPFSINLSACSTTTGSVKTYFEPGLSVNGNGRLTTNITNLDLQLLNDSQSPINLNTQAGTTTATIASNAATLKYFAQYYNTSTAAIAAGTVSASVNYTVVYP